jgi:hypothetical protein
VKKKKTTKTKLVFGVLTRMSACVGHLDRVRALDPYFKQHQRQLNFLVFLGRKEGRKQGRKEGRDNFVFVEIVCLVKRQRKKNIPFYNE